MNGFESLRLLPRTVWLIGLISLLNDSASEMVYPLVPLYLVPGRKLAFHHESHSSPPGHRRAVHAF